MSTADRYHKLFPVTWDQLHRDAKILSGLLLGHAPFTSIVAITRGGLIPAAIIARELNIRLIDTLCIATYQDREQSYNEHILKAITNSTGEGMLVVDDLVDTGNTLRIAKEMLPKAHIATIYAKPAGLALIDSYVLEVSQDTWILFPWDSEIHYAKPLIDQE